MERVAGQPGAPGGFPGGHWHPPRCPAEQFVTCDVFLMGVPACVSLRAMPSCSRDRPDCGTEHPVPEWYMQQPGFVPQPASHSKTHPVLRSCHFAPGTRKGSFASCSALSPPGRRSCSQQQQGIPCHPMAEVFSVGPQLWGHGCPDSGMDASPGAWEVASPEAFSSSVTPVRFRLNTLHHWRNLPGSASFSVIPKQDPGPPTTTRQLTGSRPRVGVQKGVSWLLLK